MRSWGRKLRRTAAELLALPPDVLDESVSRLTCVDAAEIVVENMVSLLRVTECEVEIDLGNQILLVQGGPFAVTLVAEREVHIRGDIRQITYRSKGGPSQ